MRKIIILFLFFSLAALADHTGRVVGITDGDTLTLLAAGDQPIKVRLTEIGGQRSISPTATGQSVWHLASKRPLRVYGPKCYCKEMTSSAAEAGGIWLVG
ncbi:hypothetical protein NOC27_3416 [Nitrosococcus oceani AFC27]|uniref:hypothetical protein n=1 Tax=Nitrosococcus oceani TaxID=1229 RepID=UPI000183C2FC|nr:hypothetical protein [Nitrosococcus oceani]EDZ65252.1 hypothetical protein NOC27_3416 [Nitrosococcus oceani AFC27]BBM60820.1 hypothetical protein NONS58_P0340 [Nitrosococcus oceani]